MFGHIHLCLKEFLIERYGEDTFKKFVKEINASVFDDFMLFHCYDDELTMRMFTAASFVIDKTVADILNEYGQYFYHYAAARGYDRMMAALGSTFEEFVHNLDHLHTTLASTYKGMRPPTFKIEVSSDKFMIHILTNRKGTYHIAIGLLKECAKQLFQKEINITVLDTVRLSMSSGFKDHVIVEVHGDLNQNINTSKPESNSNYIHHMSRQTIEINKDDILNIVPFGVYFDSGLKIILAGIHILALCPSILRKTTRMDELFELIDPKMEFTYEKISKVKINSFYLRMKTTRNGHVVSSSLCLKGPFLAVGKGEGLLFMGSPHYDSLMDFSEARDFMSIIPADAMSMETLFMYNQRKADMEISKELDATTSKLQKLAISLEEEKLKTDTLLYQMLPYNVANQLRDGKPVDAEKYEAVTILFSDIVGFTTMTSNTEPMATVQVLNHLFQTFDNLTNKHGVYKVETIGDAYMVAAGVPEAVKNHAQKLSHMAIEMMSECTNVQNPYTQCSLQIRIGMNSGGVVAGVVGKKMPRFCLFGDTVNTASRMESCGVAGKIHVSEATYRNLAHTDIQLQLRGFINVKGKGRMRTYFIIGRDGKVISSLQHTIRSNVCRIL